MTSGRQAGVAGDDESAPGGDRVEAGVAGRHISRLLWESGKREGVGMEIFREGSRRLPPLWLLLRIGFGLDTDEIGL